ncbi:MAG: TetR family transcriptional regulator [Micropepsaceae bacterium]
MAVCLQEHGYRSTSTTQILAKTSLSRGSLYFHFPGGKEALAVAAVQVSGRRIVNWISSEFASGPDSVAATSRLVDGFAAALGGSQFTKGCPVALSALEAGDQEPALQSAIQTVYSDWQRAISAGLTAHGMGSEDAQRLAHLALIQIEGALLLARATKSLTPMQLTKTFLMEAIGQRS